MTQPKFFAEILQECARFFGMDAEATESEVHEKLTSMTNPLADMLAEAGKAATAELTKSFELLKAQMEENTTAIASMKNDLESKAEEVRTLTDRVSALTEEAKTKAVEYEAAVVKNEAEKKDLASELSRLKAGIKGTEDDETDTVANELGNGGGKKAGSVIKNTAMDTWLKKGKS